MKTQTDSERDDKARQAPLDQLSASDFFPPGEGWNQGGSESRDPERQEHKPSEADDKRH